MNDNKSSESTKPKGKMQRKKKNSPDEDEKNLRGLATDTNKSSESTKPKGRKQTKKKNSPDEDEKNLRGLATDTKVVVVNEKKFSILRQLESVPGSVGADGAISPLNLSADFPSLGATADPEDVATHHPLVAPRWGRRNKLQDPFPCLGSLSREPLETLQDSSTSVKIAGVESSVSRVEAPLGSTLSQKVRKSKRPILLDFSAFIKKNGNGKQRHPSRVGAKSVRYTRPLLSGNILDSSTPVRNKGKFRERKKTKLSSLKTNIIKDRILKTLAQKDTDESTVIKNIDFKNEIRKYLDHRTEEKEKLKLGKKNMQSRNEKNSDVRPVPVSMTSVPTFSSKFRSYCENMITLELNAAVEELVRGLVRLQDNAFARDPVRARARKRFVTGLRESAKYLKLRRLKLLILAPDLEASSPNGALTTCIRELKEEAKISNVPCVFALDRRKLGYCSLRKAPVSAFAVMRYEGLEELFQTTMDAWKTARLIFIDNFQEKEEPESQEPPVAVAELLEKLKIGNGDGKCP